MTQCIYSEDVFELQFVLFTAILNIPENSELRCFVAALQLCHYYYISGGTPALSLLLSGRFLNAISRGAFYGVNFFMQIRLIMLEWSTCLYIHARLYTHIWTVCRAELWYYAPVFREDSRYLLLPSVLISQDPKLAGVAKEWSKKSKLIFWRQEDGRL